MIRNLAAYRTPDEVFYDPAVRMPVREPDASFAYLFFDLVPGGRIVGNNGVRHEGRIYRLISLRRHLEYWGERVDVRVNPDDQFDAMIFDRRTGSFVCKARVDARDATYSTREEITRQLIARVFRDGKELLRMAKAEVEGAKERLAEYRRARLEYVEQRVRGIVAARQRAKAALAESSSVAVIGSFSVVARDIGAADDIELTHELITEALDAGEAQRIESQPQTPTETLCAVSTRARRDRKKRTGRWHTGALSYGEIARRLGTSRRSLNRYRSGVDPWPAGMKEQFDHYERLRSEDAGETAIRIQLEASPPKPLRTWSDGEFSWANIARLLGMTGKALAQCRQGKRPWPDGTQQRFEELERRRMSK